MNIIEFEERLARWRLDAYRHRTVDPATGGFRPLSGSVADFTAIEKAGCFHFFYIERRLTEATPFYPGNEIYFGHASSADFAAWEVHDPVLLVRPGTWEGAHVWAPFVIPWKGRYLMAYTGLNDRLSQDIGLAFSDDLFRWERWEANPVSPCRDRPWSFWRTDGIASCRDPHLLEHDGKLLMTYTANTRDGRSCIALAESADGLRWDDRGPILLGPRDGYEPRLEGNHPQGSLESSNLFRREGSWRLVFNAAVRDCAARHWIVEAPSLDRFDFEARREFWSEGGCIERLASRGSLDLLAGVSFGVVRIGTVDWSREPARAVTIGSADELEPWLTASAEDRSSRGDRVRG